MSDAPDVLVSVVMPVRDEASFIDRSLRAVLTQDWPHDRLEVVVADGRSTDGTADVVAGIAAEDGRVRLVDNPEGIVPTGLNRAIEATRGDVVIRVDGHCEVPPGFVAALVADLAQHPEADCVGGVLRTAGEGTVATSIAAAQSSPLGVGSAAFRTGSPELREVDTVAFGAYRRAALARLGRFDEELVRNQDDEYNLRLTQAGGRILLDPEVVVTYHARGTLRGLWRQYLGYGRYKVRVVQKRGALSSARQLAPPALVAGLTACVAGGLVLGRPALAAAAPAAYAVAIGVAGTGIAARTDGARGPLVAAALGCLHLAYGVGFLTGLWEFRRHGGVVATLRRARPARAA